MLPADRRLYTLTCSGTLSITIQKCVPCDHGYAATQGQTAVTAYFSSQQLLLFVYTGVAGRLEIEHNLPSKHDVKPMLI